MESPICVCEDLANQLENSGWEIIRTSRSSVRTTRLWDMLITAWKSRNRYYCAIIDVFSGPAFFWAFLVGHLLSALQKPFVLTLHGGNLPTFAKRRSALVKNLLAKANRVTAPSIFLKECMLPYRNDIEEIPNPIHIDRYQFKLREKVRPRLVWLRAFHAIYNPILAVYVVRLLNERYPNISLSMIGPDKGDGSYSETIRLVNAFGLQDTIFFRGKIERNDVPKWLNKGDVFLNTSNVDNSPVSVVEAMACGLCVVSTNVGGMPYLLTDKSNALLVPPNDPTAMADAIVSIFDSQSLTRDISLNARQRAEQFDWKHILPRWDAVLTSVTAASE